MSVLADLSHIPIFVRSPESRVEEGNLRRFDELDKTRAYDFEVVMRNDATITCPRYTPANFQSLFTTIYYPPHVRIIRAVPSLPATEEREAPLLESEYHASFARPATYKEGAD